MASNELGRYKIVTDKRELLLPACSMFNRADNEEYWIDTDYDFDEGRCYIGKSDIEDMARLIGWMPTDKFVDLLEDYSKMREDYERLSQLVGSLREPIGLIHSRVNSTKPKVKATFTDTSLFDFDEGFGSSGKTNGDFDFDFSDVDESPSGKNSRGVRKS